MEIYMGNAPEDETQDGPMRHRFSIGFFVVSYALGVFLLSQFLGFLTPQVQPSLSSDADPLLPTNSDGEFRPFMRRVSEIKFCIICTFFPFLDLPVFWPVLLLYFIILCYVTLQRQIAHMIKYRYMPFTYGKPRPQAKGGSDTVRQI
ncbi:retention in endoplasmic reticulum protein 1 [Sparganum proliferum]